MLCTVIYNEVLFALCCVAWTPIHLLSCLGSSVDRAPTLDLEILSPFCVVTSWIIHLQLEPGHLTNKGTSSFPKCSSYIYFNPWNEDTSLLPQWHLYWGSMVFIHSPVLLCRSSIAWCEWRRLSVALSEGNSAQWSECIMLYHTLHTRTPL